MTGMLICRVTSAYDKPKRLNHPRYLPRFTDVDYHSCDRLYYELLKVSPQQWFCHMVVQQTQIDETNQQYQHTVSITPLHATFRLLCRTIRGHWNVFSLYSSGAGTSASTTKHSTMQRTILEVVIGSETEEHNHNNIQQNVHAQLEVFLVPLEGSGKSVVQFAARRWRFASTDHCWCPIVSVRYRRHTLQKNAKSGLCKY